MKIILTILVLLMTIAIQAQPTLGKRKKPGTPTTVSQPVAAMTTPPATVSAPEKKRLTLPFSNMEKEYWVQKVGHYYYLNGDIIVGNDFPKTMTLSIKSDYLWSNASIPIVIDVSIDNDNLTDRVLAAIGEFNQKTNICLVPRTNETDYLRLVSSKDIPGAGSSGIGRQGGMQDLQLHPDRADKGVIMHELMHAAGFFHEQSRSDRDTYIQIKPENMIAGQLYNFQIEEGNSYGDYDYCSLMHYGTTFFSMNGKATLECIQGSNVVPCPPCLGVQNAFSKTDIEGIFGLYSQFMRPPCQKVFPHPNRGLRFPSFSITASDAAQQSFRHRAEYASKNGFAVGFPNFHEAKKGIDIVGGTVLIKHGMTVWRDVPLSYLGGVQLNDFAGRMRATQDYAVARGFVGGFPNYFHADYGPGPVCGTFLLGTAAAEWRDVPIAELGNPALDDIGAQMRGANDYAYRNGFLGGFPTFYRANYGKGIVCGIILIRKEAGEWRDVVIAAGPR